MKKQNIFTLLIIAIVLVFVAVVFRQSFFKNDQNNLVRVFSSYDKVGTLQQAPPLLSQSSVLPVIKTFSFGSLTQIYEEKKFDFSFQYPDELVVEPEPRGCGTDLRQKAWVDGFLMFINNTSCESPFVNSNARSLEDYAHDYAIKKENGEVRIHILKTSNIVTSAGAKGIKQEYNMSWFGSKTNVQESVKQGVFSVRYIFYSSKNGFYFLTLAYSNQISPNVLTSFVELEEKIVNTVKYSE